MRIVIIERGGDRPTHTHTYFIDDPEMFQTLDKLVKHVQNLSSKQSDKR